MAILTSEKTVAVLLLMFVGVCGFAKFLDSDVLAKELPINETEITSEILDLEVQLEAYMLDPIDLDAVWDVMLEPMGEIASLPKEILQTKPQALESEVDMDLLFTVCCSLESGFNPNEVGDDGDAIGIVQTWKCVVEDVNNFQERVRVTGRKYTYKDRWCPNKSREMFDIYLGIWGQNFEKVNRKKPTEIDLARIWNGGPNGWNIRKTQTYAKKAKERFAKLRGEIPATQYELNLLRGGNKGYVYGSPK